MRQLTNRVLLRMQSRREELYHDLLQCNRNCGGGKAFYNSAVVMCPTPEKNCTLFSENKELHFIDSLYRSDLTPAEMVEAYFPIYLEHNRH